MAAWTGSIRRAAGLAGPANAGTAVKSARQETNTKAAALLAVGACDLGFIGGEPGSTNATFGIVGTQEDNSTIVFSFTDDTKIVGAEQGVAGLATMNGARVTVRYTVECQSTVATEVDVLK